MTVPYLPGIGQLALRYDGFVLDLWGVVHDGIAPVPGAIDCMHGLISAGKRIALLSNAPRRADDVDPADFTDRSAARLLSSRHVLG